MKLSDIINASEKIIDIILMKLFFSPNYRVLSAEETTLRWAKLSEHAFEPTKGSEQAAGLDLKR